MPHNLEIAGPEPTHALVPEPDSPPPDSTGLFAPAGFRIPEIEPWQTAVNGHALLDELKSVLTRFAVLPQWAPETLALWVLHTFAFELRDVATYIGIESPEKRCGKTTLLTALSELVNRPVVAANISPSAFFRVIEETRPTLLIDEADTFVQGNDELRGILNSGYKRKTAFVVRVAPQSSPLTSQRRTPDSPTPALPPASSIPPSAGPRSPFRTPHCLARFSCWCPKIMATIGKLPETLSDRCILLRMHRKTAHETCERLRNLDGTTLRQQCVRFVLDHREAIANARPELPEALNDRAADIWEPLFALADLAGGTWPALARQAALALTALAQQVNPIGSLLFDIFLLFQMGKTDKLFTRALVDGLNSFTDRPWAELTRARNPTAPQGVTEIWLARQLRPYGVQPRTLWIGEASARGYLQADFTDLFRRYVPRSELEDLKLKWRKPLPTQTQAAPDPIASTAE